MKERFETIWNNFHDYLSIFVEKRIIDKELKDDCVQEIFIKINNGLSTLKDESKLESWIFQIARNTISDFNRDKMNQRAVQFTNQDKEIETEENVNTEVANWIVPFIKQLPLKYAEPLRLFEIVGLSQKEISEKENIGLSATKSRIQRGRLKLKDSLIDCCKFEIDKRGNILDYRSNKDNCINC